jgi:hypothetical protein
MATAAGKWDVGYVKKHCTPTYRGYETFLGYYTGVCVCVCVCVRVCVGV